MVIWRLSWARIYLIGINCVLQDNQIGMAPARSRVDRWIPSKKFTIPLRDPWAVAVGFHGKKGSGTVYIEVSTAFLKR